MPKELICPEPGKLAWRTYEEREPGVGEVRVRCEFAAAKHGTEMAIFKGYANARGRFDGEYKLHVPGRSIFSYPASLGNMAVGRVEAVGAAVTRVGAGDRVCVHAGFRETCHIDEKECWRIPDDVSWKSAVCLDPADFALAAVRDGHVRLGDAVAVFGLGAIGLVVVQLARLAGAYPVVGVDPMENRRRVAEKFGASATIDPRECDAGLELKKLTGKRGVDVAIEYSGSADGLQQALRGVAFGGTVVAGAYPPPYGPGLDFGAEAHWNIPNLVFSRACSEPNRDYPRWDEKRIYGVCRRLIEEGEIKGEDIVEPVVAFDDLLEEYPKIATNPEENIKLGVKFE